MSIQSITSSLLVELSLQEQEIFSGTGNVIAGPIWNNEDAKGKCPRVCNSVGLKWDGNWFTFDPGKNSVCNCN